MAIPILSLFSPFRGSTSNDFDQQEPFDENPLPDCPDSPNCIRYSIEIDYPKSELYNVSVQLLRKMNAYCITEYKEMLYIEAVFRIRFFGYLDDFHIRIMNGSSDKSSVIHIRSASRTGYSDLGVNRRRVNRFLNHLNTM